MVIDGHGVITVSHDGISVTVQVEGDTNATAFREVTVEHLEDATHLLAEWMELKHTQGETQ